MLSVCCSLSVPAAYDVSLTGYNLETTKGMLNILFAYLVLDMTFYSNIIISLRVKVKTPNGMLNFTFFVC